MDAPRVAVTGANGYIGGLVAQRYGEAGWDVIRMQRRPEKLPAGGVGRPFTLGQLVSPAALAGIDLLVHCAYDFTVTTPREIYRVNVGGTERLLTAAAEAGVRRTLLVSSMSAYEGTGQVYGRAKLACEALTAAVGGISVRLGLVYGEGRGGMAGALRRLVSAPLVPLVGGRSHQFTVHEADAADGLLAAGSADAPVEGPLGLAHPDPVPFKRLLQGIGRNAGVRPRLVPVPWKPVYAAMRCAERAHVRLPLRADSLLGLVRPAPAVPRFEYWRSLGVSVRAFDL